MSLHGKPPRVNTSTGQPAGHLPEDRHREPVIEGTPPDGSFRSEVSVDGIEMIRYVGPASVLLLIVAILAAQVFQNRGMAFVGAMTVAVLVALVMDRVMVERHATWLANHRDAPGRDRVIARMEASFFHAGRVRAILDSIPHGTKGRNPREAGDADRSDSRRGN